MKNLLQRFHEEESGQDLVEYALLAALVALGCIAGMTTLSTKINSEFSKIAGDLT